MQDEIASLGRIFHSNRGNGDNEESWFTLGIMMIIFYLNYGGRRMYELKWGIVGELRMLGVDDPSWIIDVWIMAKTEFVN